VTDEDEDFNQVSESIITGRRWDHDHWWYKPAHVCRRWRNLILGSASFLGLSLVCTLGTPVADMLAHSPPLPLVINYVDGDPSITAEDEEGLFLALEQPNRIRCIRVVLSLQDLQKFVMAIDNELPILEYLIMVNTKTGREDDATLVFPETIQAPHLRHLALHCFTPAIGFRYFTSAVGLVTLYLFMGDSSTYLNPNSLLEWISPLRQLERLAIVTLPNRDHVETQLSHTPIVTHATLPNLLFLSFQGFSPSIEVIFRQIATPRLEMLHIVFFDQLSFSIPCLVRFMNTTENKLRFDWAKFDLSIERDPVETYIRDNRRCSFSIHVGRLCLKGDISSMAQIVDALGQVFSAIEHLILDHEEDSSSSEEDFEAEVDRTEWHKLLRPFRNVKYLRVNHGLVKEFSRCLQLYDGVLPPELLPQLQQLTYPGSSNVGDAFTSFIDARRNAGHPVSLVLDSPPPPAPSNLCPTDATNRFLESIEVEDEWLSMEDTVKMIGILQSDTTAAEAYIAIADDPNEDETAMRLWVKSQLESAGIQRGGNL
jgi:hypothetical protein